ncbi:MAG: ThiF family adenylyltransferase [Desulfonauticus sp.]|nr:ThiF family adenylyltransferase [Desulfonauticus sp.]
MEVKSILPNKSVRQKILKELKSQHLPNLWIKNSQAISPKEQACLFSSKVLVVGCGGLGGFVLEMLARIGVGTLIFADGDRFEESNLNRQLYASTSNLGQNKAKVAQARLKQIAPLCRGIAIPRYLSLQNVVRILPKCDLVLDCVGGIEFKAELIHVCQKHQQTLITGAVAGWEGFVSSITATSKSPLSFFSGVSTKSAENTLGTPVTSVNLIATLQVQEAILWLTQKKLLCLDKVLYVSLDRFDFMWLKL